MFQGLRTVIYAASDLQKAKEWYTQALGKEPYFDQPFYVGFNVGGYELGLDPDTKASHSRQQRGGLLGRRGRQGRPRAPREPRRS